MSSSLEKVFLLQNLHISVIIPTHESAETLPRCLQSLQEQSYPIHEIIVVDGFSNDKTRETAHKLGSRVILTFGTQAAARNVGLANSKGDYVLFLDSDQKLEDSVIEDCISRILRCGAEAVKIPEEFVGVNFWGRCSALWKNRMVKAWGGVGGIPRFYRRNTLTQSTAFDDKLRFWEDLELYQRLKSSGLRDTWCRSRVVHYETDSVRQMIRKYVSYGQSISKFKSNRAKAPYASTIKLTLSTMAQTLRDPGGSLGEFFGCLFLVAVKALSVAFGFLSR
jgi:arabinofuranan 3-O-arabinosyltransferase